jgi:hypothetical protein
LEFRAPGDPGVVAWRAVKLYRSSYLLGQEKLRTRNYAAGFRPTAMSDRPQGRPK